MSQHPPPSAFDQPVAPKSNGMAIGALVCSIIACIPGLPIVGLVLGIVAMNRAKSQPERYGGHGLALAAVIIGGIGIIPSCAFSAGIFLPALGKARQSARQLKSSTQVRQIQMALLAYANDNRGWFPEPGADWQARLGKYAPTPGIFVSPFAGESTAGDSYLYVPGYTVPSPADAANVVLVYDNPVYVPRGKINIGMADGTVQAIRVQELQAYLDAAPKPGSKPAAPVLPKRGN